MKVTERIERSTLLAAPRARVWKALSDAGEFGTWFRFRTDGPFVAGRTVTGRVTYPGAEHLRFELVVERMDAGALFSFRWHPYAVDPEFDYSKEPRTLVEFRIEDAPGGTRLTVIESGFDGIPAGRRDEAFRMNAGGWDAQLKNLATHLAG